MIINKIDRSEITNTFPGSENPLFLSYKNKMVGMIKMSDFNQWYPVFVNRSFGYDFANKTAIANPVGISSIYLTDIIDWATTHGFEIYSSYIKPEDGNTQ